MWKNRTPGRCPRTRIRPVLPRQKTGSVRSRSPDINSTEDGTRKPTITGTPDFTSVQNYGERTTASGASASDPQQRIFLRRGNVSTGEIVARHLYSSRLRLVIETCCNSFYINRLRRCVWLTHSSLRWQLTHFGHHFPDGKKPILKNPKIANPKRPYGSATHDHGFGVPPVSCSA